MTLVVSLVGRRLKNARELKKNPRADSLKSSSMVEKTMEIFMWLLNLSLLGDCHSVKWLRETSLYRHEHNFTHPKVKRVNDGETLFLNSCSQPSFMEALTTKQIQTLFCFKKKALKIEKRLKGDCI